VLFDLGRGGRADDPALRPTATTGAAAVDAASDGPVAQGGVGAGVGAQAGGLTGGIGTASAVLDDGTVVAALAAVNAAGSAIDPATGGLLGARLGLPGEFALPPVGDAARATLREIAAGRPGLGTATTLAVVATDATLDKAGCARLATMGHDGLARALAPAHTATDGDTVFGLATGARRVADLAGLVALQVAAADVVSRAVVHAVLAAETVTTPAGTWRSYRDVVGAG
jgi:L-aminopeptidase/D-esterase-like protein